MSFNVAQCGNDHEKIFAVAGQGRFTPSSPLVKTLLLISSLAALVCLIAPTHGQSGPNPAQTLVNTALKDFEDKKFDEALGKLQEAEKLDPQSAFILNLIGAAYTKKKDYAAAKASFEKALAIDYSFFPAQFNVGELYFLQKQYPQALEYFTRMLNNDPGNELLQFKVILCLLQTDQIEDAQKLAARMKFPGDGPGWYYAQAALKLKQGEKRKAAELISNATTIFPAKISLFAETFDDLGWKVN